MGGGSVFGGVPHRRMRSQCACAIIWVGSARTKTRTPSHFVCQAGKQTFKDRHICTMVYGALLISATDTN